VSTCHFIVCPTGINVIVTEQHFIHTSDTMYPACKCKDDNLIEAIVLSTFKVA